MIAIESIQRRLMPFAMPCWVVVNTFASSNVTADAAAHAVPIVGYILQGPKQCSYHRKTAIRFNIYVQPCFHQTFQDFFMVSIVHLHLPMLPAHTLRGVRMALMLLFIVSPVKLCLQFCAPKVALMTQWTEVIMTRNGLAKPGPHPTGHKRLGPKCGHRDFYDARGAAAAPRPFAFPM